jgi:hypothetical protein
MGWKVAREVTCIYIHAFDNTGLSKAHDCKVIAGIISTPTSFPTVIDLTFMSKSVGGKLCSTRVEKIFFFSKKLIIGIDNTGATFPIG